MMAFLEHNLVLTEILSASAPLECYFNFWYFLGICPFRLKFRRNFFVVSQNVVQKGICLVILGFMVLSYLSWLRFLLYENMKKQAAYFAISDFCGNLFIWTTFVVTVWTKSSLFNDLANAYFRSFSFKYHHASRVKPFIFFWIGLVALLKPGFYVLILLEQSRWDVQKIAATFMTDGYQLFFLSQDSNRSPLNVLTGLVYFLVVIYSILFNAAFNTILLASAVALKMAVGQTHRKVNSFGCSEIEVFYHYEKLREVCHLNNNGVGLSTLGFILGFIPFLMYGIPGLLQPKSFFSLTSSILGIAIPFGFFILTTLIAQEASTMFENKFCSACLQRQTRSSRRRLLFYFFSKRNVSFVAGGLIPLTLQFLASVMSLVLTTSVVIVEHDNVRT